MELWSSHCENKPEKWSSNSKSCAFTYSLARTAASKTEEGSGILRTGALQIAVAEVIWGLESLSRKQEEDTGLRIPLRSGSICHRQRSSDIWDGPARRKGSEGSYLCF